MWEKDLWKKLVAEFVGAFILTSAIIFPSVALRDAGLGAFLFIMFTAAMGMAMVVWLFRDISGGHANPAVTFAMMIMRKMPVLTGVLYWVAQLLGATASAFYVKGTFKLDSGAAADLGNFGMALPTPGYKDFQIVMAEALAAFILVAVVLAVGAVKDRVSAGLAIGGALLVAVVMSAPISGGAVNPAREFGPVLVANGFKDVYLWYYLVGPFVGALVAVLVHILLNEQVRFRVPTVASRRTQRVVEDEE